MLHCTRLTSSFNYFTAAKILKCKLLKTPLCMTRFAFHLTFVRIYSWQLIFQKIKDPESHVFVCVFVTWFECLTKARIRPDKDMYVGFIFTRANYMRKTSAVMYITSGYAVIVEKFNRTHFSGGLGYFY